MGKLYKITESQLNLIVEHIFDESGHSEKLLKDVFKYIKNNMGCEITNIKDGYRVCAPQDKSKECWTMHRDDKGIPHLMRYLAKSFGVSKRVLELGIKANEKFEKIKQKSEEKMKEKN